MIMYSLKSSLHRLLRWSERYTKTDMVYLARGGFWSIAGQIVTTLTILGFAILVAHYLPKEVYGQYKYIIAVVAILSSFSLTGIGTAVFQSAARGFDGALFEGFWLNVRWSALIFLGAFALAIYYFFQGNPTLAFGVLIGGSLSPFLASANLASTFLSAKKDFARSSIYYDIIENLFAVGALAVTILLTHNPLIIAIVYFVGNTLVTYWLYRRVIRIYKPDPAKTDPEMLTYGKHLSLMGILNGIAGNIDQILLFHFVGPAQLAIYNFATAIPDQTKGPLKTLNTMLQANFANRPTDEIHGGMRNKMFVLFVTSLAFVVLYIVFAPFIYHLLFPNYMEAVPYSQIYVLSLLAITVNPATSYLLAKKKIQEQYINTFITVTFQIVLLAGGVIFFGLLGLIGARALIRISGAFLTYILYKRAVRREPARAI